MKKCRILLLLTITGMLTGILPMTASAEWSDTANGRIYTQSAAPGYVTGLAKIEEHFYYFNDQGIMQTGFQVIDNQKYYFDASGQMKTGRFVATDGKTYYANKTGVLAINRWVGKRYYQADGSMAVNTWVGNKYVGANGQYTGTVSGTGWVTKNGQKYYYSSDGEPVKGKTMLDGKLYFFDPATGAMKKGWFKVNKNYYFANSNGVLVTNKWKSGRYLTSGGEAATGWTEINGTSYLFSASGKQRSGWTKYQKAYYYCIKGVVQKNTWIDKKKYYVLGNGVRAAEWQNIDGNTYYFDPATGAKKTGFAKIGTLRYYFASNGRLRRNMWISGKKYYASASGALLTGLQNINGSLYFFKANGRKLTNKLKVINGDSYYFINDGTAAKDTWVKIGSDYYCFARNGKMIKNKWVGNFYVDLNGARTNQTKKTGWQTVDGQKYYYNKKGSMVLGWKDLDGSTYYFDPATGVMLTGLQTIDNKKYYFYVNGPMATSITIAVGMKEYTIGADGVITDEKSIKISGDSMGVKIVNFALQYVGNPYVWGGTSLTNGADCSGFVQTVFANFDIKLLRVADDQMKGPSDAISADYKRPTIVDFSNVENMQPGDLIFYGSANYATHVAIYMGDGRIVHASNSQPYPAGGIKITENYDYNTPIRVVRYWS